MIELPTELRERVNLAETARKVVLLRLKKCATLCATSFLLHTYYICASMIEMFKSNFVIDPRNKNERRTPVKTKLENFASTLADDHRTISGRTNSFVSPIFYIYSVFTFPPTSNRCPSQFSR